MMAPKPLTDFDPSEYDPTESLHSVIFSFQFCGLWPIQYRFRSLYLIYGFFFQLAFTYAFVGFKLLNFITRTNLDQTTVIIFESVAEISLCIRVGNFIIQFADIIECLTTIKSFKCRNREEMLFLKKRFRLFTRVLRIYFSCASFACLFSLVAPFFADKPMLAYPAHYPFLDWQHNRIHFWIAYTYQFVGILFLAHTLILLESYHIYLLIAIGGLLDVLGLRLRRIGSEDLDEPDAIGQDKAVEIFLVHIKSFEMISR